MSLESLLQERLIYALSQLNPEEWELTRFTTMLDKVATRGNGWTNLWSRIRGGPFKAQLHRLVQVIESDGLDGDTVADCLMEFTREFFKDNRFEIEIRPKTGARDTLHEICRVADIASYRRTMQRNLHSLAFGCIDRHPQVDGVETLYSQKSENENKMLIICHGPDREGHRFLVDRLVNIELPALLGVDDGKVEKIVLKLPEQALPPERFVAYLGDQVKAALRKRELGDVLGVSPILVAMYLKDDHELTLVERTMQHWHAFHPPQAAHPFIACLCLQRSEPETPGGKRVWAWPENFADKDALLCYALPDLPGITRRHAEDWADELFPDDSSILINHIQSFYKKQSCAEVKLGDLVDELDPKMKTFIPRQPAPRLQRRECC